MRAHKSLGRWLSFLTAVGLAAAYAACSSHSPTEPSAAPSNPKVPVPTPVINVTVTANPAHLTTGQAAGSNITITARLASSGQAPPDLTPVTLTTTLGEFGVVGSGTQTLNLQLVGGQAQAVLFPGLSAGAATIAATINAAAGAGTGSATVRIDQPGVFFLSAVAPNVGNPAGGDVVTITGGGFIAPVNVTFGGNSAQVRSVSGGQIVVATPPSSTPVGVGQTLAVSVTVTNNVGSQNPQTQTLINAFTYAPGGSVQQPQVFSVNPASGTNDGGTRVVLTGQGFLAPVQVLFGSGASASTFQGVEASIQSVTPTQIVVITPPANGFGQDNRNLTVNILVKNLSSGFSTVAASAFKYGSSILVTSIEPGQTVWNQPVKVILFGQGFLDPVAVGLAGVAATVLSTSGTEIQVLSPVPVITSCANVTGPSKVVNVSNGDGAQGPPFTFVVPKPFITGIAPSSGGELGGDRVAISGGNFDPPNVQVTFNGVIASPSPGSTSTTLFVITPQFTGTFPTQTCATPSGPGTQKIPIAVDVVETNLDTTCTATAHNGFIYNPADPTCHPPPPPPPPPVVKPSCSFTFVSSGLKVQFTDTSTNNPTSFSWDFGDTGTSTVENPSHTYGAPGSYIVSLTVANSAGSSECAQKVTVP